MSNSSAEQRCAPAYLSSFSSTRPVSEIDQARSLAWLADAHVESEVTRHGLDATARETFRRKIAKAIQRVACGASAISSRGHVLPDVGSTDWNTAAIYDLRNQPRGKGTAARSSFFRTAVADYFEHEYEAATAPTDLIHVTCTGYVAPSGAQRLVAARNWGSATRVTHAYHMGCYAAVPAVRIAMGCLRVPPPSAAATAHRVDVVHTELCSLHLDPSNHSLEQLVVQSLFADGFIRYAVETRPNTPALEILAVVERLIPASADAMSWVVSDAGMAMTLSREVPERIGAALRDFVTDLYRQAGLDQARELSRTWVAVHPGGPRIIDSVRERLELTHQQVQTSREVLFAYGNMSSATLPHIWMKLVNNTDVPVGALIMSLAFGPGLTMCGALFRKA